MNNTVPPKVYEILKKLEAVNGNMNNFIVNVDDPNKKGEGFLGQIFFISLKDRITGKELNFVVKQALSQESVREHHPIRNVFLNEIYFYTKLWPELSDFQERITPEIHFSHLPKYFAAISEETFERLLLENLKYQGFVMHDKEKVLEKEKIEFIFKVYGKFHAMSFAYKALYPEKFSELVKGVTDLWMIYSNKTSFKDSTKLAYEACLECFQPGVDDVIIEKCKDCIDTAVGLFQKSLDNGQYTCVTHGDCWSNNMMFKYDGSGKLIDVRFLDFQFVRVGSPVCDLAYCLYSGGAKQTLDDLDHLLQVYYDSLSKNLRAYGCDPEEMYPLNALKDDWKVHCQLGMTMGVILWRGKLTYDDNMIDLVDISEGQGEMSKFYETKYDKETFKERIRDLMFHLYENDYLF